MPVKYGRNAMGWFQCCLAFTATSALAQSTNPAAGPEIRAYPAGLIGAARLDLPLGPNGWVMNATAGYNLTRRGDFGRHDDERGGGPGLGIGVDHRFRAGPDGWFAGVRIDWWWLGVDWLDRAPGRSGRTAPARHLRGPRPGLAGP